jgi:hypothetical protein
MRAPSRAICLPTEVSEECDDGIESALGTALGGLSESRKEI